MPKLKPDHIVLSDLLDYLNGYSDFSFELATLKLLRAANLECEHGGLYEDPITRKTREFDIRATQTHDRHRVRLAVECKNIRANFPVLISCVPRHADESYHEIALLREPNDDHMRMSAGLYTPRSKVLRIDADHSFYEPGEPVGKSTAQVGKLPDGSISANDSELHEKWGQCLSSATELVERTYWDGSAEKEKPLYFSTVVPIVVVPDDRLWTVNYDNDGNRTSDPTPADRCSCFADKSYRLGTKMAGSNMSISHVEVVTTKGLSAFVQKYLPTPERMSILFPKAGIAAAFNRGINKT